MTIVREKKRTAFQVARILAALENGPMTGEQIAQAVFLSYGSVMNYIQLLREEKKVYLRDWQRSPMGRASGIFALGARRDKPFKRKGKEKKGSRAEQRYAQILAVLAVPTNMHVLSATIGLTDRQMAVHVRKLRNMGKAYICQWKRSAGNPVPYYLAGQDVDAIKPGPKPRRHYTKLAALKRSAWVGSLSAPILPVPRAVKNRILSDEPIRILKEAA